MKRRMRIAIYVLFVLATFVFALVSCGGEGLDSKHAHTLVEHDAKAATCTESGWEAYTACSECDYSTYTEIKPLGHDFINRVCRRCQILKASEGLEFNAGNDTSKTCSVTGIGTCTDTVIVIPEKDPKGYTVRGIWSSAFRDCEDVTDVIIPETVTYISSYAFDKCSNLVSINFPSGMKTIGDGAFMMCSSLESAIIPDSVEYIGTCAFADCTSLKNVNIGNGVTEISSRAFERCTSLTDLNIGSSVQKIGRGAFSACSSLIGVTIPDSVYVIDEHAFENCISLTSIKIGKHAEPRFSIFDKCYKLVEIINTSWHPYEFGQIDVLVTHNGETKIVNQDGYMFITVDGVNYLLGYTGEDTALVLPKSYNGEKYEIYKYAFYNRDDLTSIEISDGATKIGKYAFWSCDGLGSLVIPESVTVIGDSAFSECLGIERIVISEGVKTIGSGAFSCCKSLASVVIPNSVVSFGDHVFWRCESLAVIEYCGTEEQWNAITKGNYWDSDAGAYTITYNYTGER